jgi:soluble lytic murein transglycosylase-like protein
MMTARYFIGVRYQRYVGWLTGKRHSLPVPYERILEPDAFVKAQLFCGLRRTAAMKAAVNSCIAVVNEMKNRFFQLFAIGLGAWAAAAPAHADCFDEAAKYQQVNPLILRAIAWQESHNHPDAMNKNANGSVDYGLMQINSIHLNTLAHYGINSGTLMQPCKSVYVAAWHLRQKMNKYGNTWQAVGAYHSETPSLRDKYSKQIIDILGKWKLLTASR